MYTCIHVYFHSFIDSCIHAYTETHTLYVYLFSIQYTTLSLTPLPYLSLAGIATLVWLGQGVGGRGKGKGERVPDPDRWSGKCVVNGS